MKNARSLSSILGGSISASRRAATTLLNQLVRPGVLLLLACLCLAAHAQQNEWTWMGGSSTIPVDFQPGIYGTLGTPTAGNIPGSRSTALSWTDSNGNLWLFGGIGVDAIDSWGVLNDMWKFDPSTNQWTWMGGSSTIASWNSNNGQPGVYGTLGTFAPGNVPGGRGYAMGWTDSSGNFWLFGGWGYAASGVVDYLNDLWEFNPSKNEWAWMGGSNTTNQPGVYGTLGMPAPGNIPGSCNSATSWTDRNGHLWLFGGGACFDANGNSGLLNSMWEFNPSTNEWAWRSGSNTINQPGVYGTLGTPAAGNIPGARGGTTSWTDSSGYLWLFGGGGYDTNGNSGQLNDLWEFNPSTNQWAWMGGSSTINQPGMYGTLETPATGNIPGARISASHWSDSSGHLWLFGGSVTDTNGNWHNFDDLWKFNPSTREWAWMSGSSIAGSEPGVYGTLGTPSAGNVPGGRDSATSWNDSSGNFWLFGGYILYANGNYYLLNDLWKYQPAVVNSPISTTIALISSQNPSVYMQPVTLTANVTSSAGAPPNGEIVTFMNGAATLGTGMLSGGTASFTTSALPVGTYPITAVYGGDANFVASTSMAVGQTVGQANSSITLTSSPNPSSVGASATFTATASGQFGGAATGTVTFSNGSATLGTATLSGGSAVFTFTPLSVGTNSITALFSGDSNFSGSTSNTVSQVVTAVASGGNGVIYDNGMPTHATLLANNITYFIGAEDFTLASTQDVTAVRAWLYGDSGYAGSIAWTIYANAGNQPGAVLASGNAPATFTPTGFIWGDSTPEYQMDFQIPPFTAVASTTYWLGIRNAVPNPQDFPSHIPPFDWEVTNPNGTLTSYFFGYGCCGSPTGWFSISEYFESIGVSFFVGEHAFQLLSGSVAAAPTFSPTAGTYTSVQTVSISDTTPGATIYYTLDGSTPTTASAVYSTALTVSATTTINAIAVAAGYSNSAVASAIYIINLPPAAAPVFTPGAGTYTSIQSVKITDATTGAAIYYTLDGSTPTTGSAKYSGAISVSQATTINAIAAVAGFSNSPVASATYTINLPPAAAPTFNPAAGTYTSIQTVTLADATTGASIYYTLDGSTPTTVSAKYSKALTVSQSTTINAIAVATGYSSSAVASVAYTLNLPPAAAPAFSVSSGTYTSIQKVKLSDSITGATIYYTLDGSTPTAASTKYTVAITVSQNTTINAIAVATDYAVSAVSSASYVITLPAAAPTFTPAAGTYGEAQSVTLASTTPNATIYYTTDGSAPSESSTVYAGPLTVSAAETIKAIASATGYIDSPVGSAKFALIGSPQVITGLASAIATPTAMLNATVNDFGAGGDVWFVWGTDSAASSFSTPVTALSASTGAQSVSVTLTGLNSGTTYYFRPVATTIGGTSYGAIQSFIAN